MTIKKYTITVESDNVLSFEQALKDFCNYQATEGRN
jgi:hypothetical protein